MVALEYGIGLVTDRSHVQFPAGLFSRMGLLNRVPASAEGKGGNLTSAEWQLTMCDPYGMWVSRSGEAKLLLTAIHCLLLLVQA